MSDSDIDLDRVQLQLAAGRAKAAMLAPYLATALFSIEVTQTDRVPTAAVSWNWMLYYNPSFISKLTANQCAGIWLHEVSHLLRSHGLRARSRGVSTNSERELWNIAADMTINTDLRREGVELPSGAIYTEDLDLGGFTASTDELYGLLTKWNWGFKHHYGEDFSIWDCGSSVDAVARDWEEPDVESEENHLPTVSTAELEGDLKPPTEKAKRVINEVAAEILEASRAHNGPPPSWITWANGLLNPTVDWRTELRRLIRRTLTTQGAGDYSRTRLSRRESEDFLLASMRSPHSPRCCAVVDTSGSMNRTRVNLALAELDGMNKALGGAALTVMLCDTRVNKVIKRYRPGTEILFRGGGTDLVVGIEAAARLRPRFDLIVTITDGMTPWPNRPPIENPSASYLAVLVAESTDAPSWIRSIHAADRDDQI